MADGKKPGLINRIKRAASAAITKVKEAAQLDFFARFKTEDTDQEIDFPIDMAGETVWATRQQIAKLFDIQSANIVNHISNIYAEGELTAENTTSKIAGISSKENDINSVDAEYYNLDMILAIGYRISNRRATAFRKWSTEILKGYIQEGYALNGRRLNSDPQALLRLAQEVRAIRTSEKNLYEQVRETFKACSIDYDSSSEEARRFFSFSQDKFHYAVSESTSAQIILARADGTKPNMGMTALGNRNPTFADAKVAKNYLNEKELRSMEILGEQWLLYAESMAIRQKTVSMQRLLGKLDDLIKVHEYSIFPGYDKIGAKRSAADNHAKEQLEVYRKNQIEKL